MGVSAAAFCLDEASATIYVLDTGTNAIWVIDTATAAVTRTIDVTSIISNPYLLTGSIQVHNNTIWMTSLGALVAGYPDQAVPHMFIYQIDATTGAITAIDKSADITSTLTSSIISNGTLFVPGIFTQFLVNADGVHATWNNTLTVLTDTSVDFLAAGVTTSDFLVFGSYGNPGIAIDSVAQHQITLASAVYSSHGSYQIVTSSSSVAYESAVLGEYDGTTGSGLAVPISGALAHGYLAYLTTNRQTNTLFGVPLTTPNMLVQINGVGITYAAVPISADADASTVVTGFAGGGDGHIHIATQPGSVPNGAIVTFQNIYDGAPHTSDPWPGPGGYAVGIDTVGNNTYGVDATHGLYVMLGDGPSITLLDSTIPPILVDPISSIVGNGRNNFNTTIIGDPAHNGLWLLYSDQVVFWDIATATTKYTIPLFYGVESSASITASSSITAPVDVKRGVATSLTGNSAIFATTIQVVKPRPLPSPTVAPVQGLPFREIRQPSFETRYSIKKPGA